MSHAIFSTEIFFHSSQVCSPGWVIIFLSFTYEYKLKVSKTLYTVECQNCFNYIYKKKKKKKRQKKKKQKKNGTHFSHCVKRTDQGRPFSQKFIILIIYSCNILFIFKFSFQQ